MLDGFGANEKWQQYGDSPCAQGILATARMSREDDSTRAQPDTLSGLGSRAGNRPNPPKTGLYLRKIGGHRILAVVMRFGEGGAKTQRRFKSVASAGFLDLLCHHADSLHAKIAGDAF